MSERFRHEDVAAVPSGWKVRTVSHGSHRVRVAFPPGRKQKGAGRLVSILHPTSGKNPCGNPCTLRSTNPAELLVLGANPPRRRGADARKQREAEKLRAKMQKLADSAKRKGINPAELLVMGANPRVEVVHGDNPPVEDITEEFTGTEVKYLDVYNEPHMPQGRYAYLAKLFRLLIKPAKGGQVQKITFNENDAPQIVSDSTARQIYFVGGGQDLSSCLEAFLSEHDLARRALDNAKTVTLGEGREIHYLGVKHHIGDEDTEEWRHKLGEENGALPTVLFDVQHKRILFEGGDYRIEGPWIHN